MLKNDYTVISTVTNKPVRTVKRTMKFLNTRPYISPGVNGRTITYTEKDMKTIKKVFRYLDKSLSLEQVDVLFTHEYKKSNPTLTDYVTTNDTETNPGLW